MNRLPLIIILIGMLSLLGCQSGDATLATVVPAIVAPDPTQTTTNLIEPMATATRAATSTVMPTPEPTQTQTPIATTLNAFDGERAFAHLEAQMDLGPRWPGSPGHKAVADLIITELSDLGWVVEEQLFEYRGFEARNLIARANQGQGEVIILGAHYDTRRLADQTPGAAAAGQPVPGAVDGASGVAVLLELGRTLDLAQIPREVWLVFFDVEDNGRGGIPGWEYAAGSPVVADSLSVTPEAVVVVDMIGDADQQLYYEGNSDAELRELLWSIAASLGYNESFIPTLRHTMLDDHLAFVNRGIRTVLIIDFDYPYWHTVEDTLDKTSPESLLRVGHTLEFWLENHLDD